MSMIAKNECSHPLKCEMSGTLTGIMFNLYVQCETLVNGMELCVSKRKKQDLVVKQDRLVRCVKPPAH